VEVEVSKLESDQVKWRQGKSRVCKSFSFNDNDSRPTPNSIPCVRFTIYIEFLSLFNRMHAYLVRKPFFFFPSSSHHQYLTATCNPIPNHNLFITDKRNCFYQTQIARPVASCSRCNRTCT